MTTQTKPRTLPGADNFVRRHVGPGDSDVAKMLDVLGHDSLDDLIDAVIPRDIRLKSALEIPAGKSEYETLSGLRALAAKNKVYRSYIVLGYHDRLTTLVIQRNVRENPVWYTANTPYQAEIAQGRLDALLTCQTMVLDLTALEIANASLLDEATAAAEAMAMSYGVTGKPGKEVFFVSDECHPQTIDVVQTRAAARGITVEVGDFRSFKPGPEVF